MHIHVLGDHIKVKMDWIKFSVLLMVVAVCSVMATDDGQETATVSTPIGPITGIKYDSSHTGKTVYEFRGIPYAKPPVGNLRFRKPVPVDKWTEPLDATSFRAGCAQKVPFFLPDFAPKLMSEDCLFLNVYVPTNLNPNSKLPVMVWIHGGGLYMGYSNQYDGSLMATAGNVIVVTMNYRLDSLGYLALAHPASLGNYGLWDQKQALQWVHDNIASFGGDPNAVTIFGESAGGWSVSFQTLIPSNKGLFQRAIAQSGTVNQMCFTHKNSKLTNERLIDFAKVNQCPINDMNKFVSCLRSKNESELLTDIFDFTSKTADNWDAMLFLPHTPVVDGDLFKTDPLEDLNDPSSEVSIFFRSLDFITGYTSNENMYFGISIPPVIQEHYKFNGSEGIPASFLCDGVITPFVKKYYNGDQTLTDQICAFYTGDKLSDDDQSARASQFANDLVFNVDATKMLEHHSGASGKTFQYVYSKKTVNGLMGPPPKYEKGAAHGDELQYLFPMEVLLPMANQSYNDFSNEEKKLSTALINYFTSFARTGIPDGGEGSSPWKQFDLKDRTYLDIDVTQSLKQNANSDSIEFWLRGMPRPGGNVPVKDYKIHDEL